MSWAAVAGAAVSVVGGYMSNKSAKKAAGAATNAEMAAIEEQRRQYDQTRQDNMPWLTAGQNALARQDAVLNGDYSGFESSPDYLWARQEMTQAGDRSAAARGGLYSGGYQADLAERIGGLASQNLGNYWNRLAGQAGQGQATASGLGTLGANAASNIGNSLVNAGSNRASSYLAQGDNAAQVAGAIGGAFNNWYQNRSANNGGGTGWYLGNNPGRG